MGSNSPPILQVSSAGSAPVPAWLYGYYVPWRLLFGGHDSEIVHVLYGVGDLALIVDGTVKVRSNQTSRKLNMKISAKLAEYSRTVQREELGVSTLLTCSRRLAL